MIKRRPIRNKRGRLVAYAVLLSNSRGIEQWAIQRGKKPLQKRTFRNKRDVRRAVLGTKAS